MNEELKDRVTDSNVWMRLLFMALFGIAFAVSRFVLFAVVVTQFFWLLFSGSVNSRLLTFGGQLSNFVYQILCYLTFNTETRPYPFSDWPADSLLVEDRSESADEQSVYASTEEVSDVVLIPESTGSTADSKSDTGYIDSTTNEKTSS